MQALSDRAAVTGGRDDSHRHHQPQHHLARVQRFSGHASRWVAMRVLCRLACRLAWGSGSGGRGRGGGGGGASGSAGGRVEEKEKTSCFCLDVCLSGLESVLSSGHNNEDVHFSLITFVESECAKWLVAILMSITTTSSTTTSSGGGGGGGGGQRQEWKNRIRAMLASVMIKALDNETLKSTQFQYMMNGCIEGILVGNQARSESGLHTRSGHPKEAKERMSEVRRLVEGMFQDSCLFFSFPPQDLQQDICSFVVLAPGTDFH